MSTTRRDAAQNRIRLLPAARTSAPDRLVAVDLLRGLLMALMALGHVRHFLSDSLEFAPTDLSRTTPALFLTRWITHFCAPGFVFLAGTGVYLLSRNRMKLRVSKYLVVRGLWLVLLELTVVRCFGWQFNYDYSYALAGVLWAIGWSLLLLALLVHLEPYFVALIGWAIIAGHNLFDTVRPRDLGSMGWLWSILHRPGLLEPFDGMRFKIGYPLLPWTGILAVGFGFGLLLELPTATRRRSVMALGVGVTVAFVALRALNVYGDPRPWTSKGSLIFSLFSFLNCDKYPPSLLFSLMTLGPILILFSALDRSHGSWASPLIELGRVPLFYYILHIPVIHLLAVALGYLRYGEAGFLFQNPPRLHGPPFPLPPAYGYSLPVVYLVWAVVVLLLLLPCRKFGRFKRERRSWWLSYFL